MQERFPKPWPILQKKIFPRKIIFKSNNLGKDNTMLSWVLQQQFSLGHPVYEWKIPKCFFVKVLINTDLLIYLLGYYLKQGKKKIHIPKVSFIFYLLISLINHYLILSLLNITTIFPKYNISSNSTIFSKIVKLLQEWSQF